MVRRVSLSHGALACLDQDRDRPKTLGGQSTVNVPSSLSHIDAIARAIVREQTNRRKARLGDRARVNLALLYRGRPAGGVGTGRVERGENSTFGDGLEISTL
jgi:hypothetical protein